MVKIENKAKNRAIFFSKFGVRIICGNMEILTFSGQKPGSRIKRGCVLYAENYGKRETETERDREKEKERER